MNWYSVADLARDKMCDEARRYGSCGCNKRGRNPCQYEKEIAGSCEKLGAGEEPQHSPAAIRKWLDSRRCGNSRAGRPCNHRGCIKTEDALEFVASGKAA